LALLVVCDFVWPLAWPSRLTLTGRLILTRGLIPRN
jgi:hypothetical protein